MKKKIIISIIVISIFSIAIYFAMIFLCEVEIKCKNCTQTSNTKEQSKKNGFYIMDYKPIKPVIQLKNYDEKIIFNDVWVESQWFYNSDNCLNTKFEKRYGYNIVFEYKKTNEGTFLFDLTPVINGILDKTNSGIMEMKKEIRLQELTDTIWLQIHEKNPQKRIGWKKKLKGELIGFIKK